MLFSAPFTRLLAAAFALAPLTAAYPGRVPPAAAFQRSGNDTLLARELPQKCNSNSDCPYQTPLCEFPFLFEPAPYNSPQRVCMRAPYGNPCSIDAGCGSNFCLGSTCSVNYMDNVNSMSCLYDVDCGNRGRCGTAADVQADGTSLQGKCLITGGSPCSESAQCQSGTCGFVCGGDPFGLPSSNPYACGYNLYQDQYPYAASTELADGTFAISPKVYDLRICGYNDIGFTCLKDSECSSGNCLDMFGDGLRCGFGQAVGTFQPHERRQHQHDGQHCLNHDGQHHEHHHTGQHHEHHHHRQHVDHVDHDRPHDDDDFLCPSHVDNHLQHAHKLCHVHVYLHELDHQLKCDFEADQHGFLDVDVDFHHEQADDDYLIDHFHDKQAEQHLYVYVFIYLYDEQGEQHVHLDIHIYNDQGKQHFHIDLDLDQSQQHTHSDVDVYDEAYKHRDLDLDLDLDEQDKASTSSSSSSTTSSKSTVSITAVTTTKTTTTTTSSATSTSTSKSTVSSSSPTSKSSSTTSKPASTASSTTTTKLTSTSPTTSKPATTSTPTSTKATTTTTSRNTSTTTSKASSTPTSLPSGSPCDVNTWCQSGYCRAKLNPDGTRATQAYCDVKKASGAACYQNAGC
ncbi:hypothetical protein OC844_006042, partial [Tilletia horrida]